MCPRQSRLRAPSSAAQTRTSLLTAQGCHLTLLNRSLFSSSYMQATLPRPHPRHQGITRCPVHRGPSADRPRPSTTRKRRSGAPEVRRSSGAYRPVRRQGHSGAPSPVLVCDVDPPTRAGLTCAQAEGNEEAARVLDDPSQVGPEEEERHREGQQEPVYQGVRGGVGGDEAAVGRREAEESRHQGPAQGPAPLKVLSPGP